MDLLTISVTLQISGHTKKVTRLARIARVNINNVYLQITIIFKRNLFTICLLISSFSNFSHRDDRYIHSCLILYILSSPQDKEETNLSWWASASLSWDSDLSFFLCLIFSLTSTIWIKLHSTAATTCVTPSETGPSKRQDTPVLCSLSEYNCYKSFGLGGKVDICHWLIVTCGKWSNSWQAQRNPQKLLGF